MKCPVVVKQAMARMQLDIANAQDEQLVRAWIQHCVANEMQEIDTKKWSPKRRRTLAAESQPCTEN